MIYKKFITWLGARKRNKALRNIRDTMMLLGYDISVLSDQEIEDGLVNVSKRMNDFGITAKQAVENLRLIGKALHTPEGRELMGATGIKT